ncbi:Uncharacterised protein [Vibrio cholerae]|nr:Uncharacterised protein [Vibrio cholerae]CSI54415.1 Uncharacterised protein [Vibrio cholerae]
MQFTLKTIHRRKADDDHRHTNRNPNRGRQRNKRHHLVTLFSATKASANKQSERGKHLSPRDIG